MSSQNSPYVDINNVYNQTLEKRDEDDKVKYGPSEVELYFYLPEYNEMLGILDDYAGRILDVYNIHFLIDFESQTLCNQIF